MDSVESKVTASRLRENIYSILDEVLETGVPVEIVRKGRTLRIVADGGASKLSKLAGMKRREGIIGNPDGLIHIDWVAEWSEMQKPKTMAARR